MSDAQQFGAGRQQVRKQIKAQMPGIVNRKDFQPGTFAVAQQLPGHDIGVMLGFRDDNFVSRIQKSLSKTVRNQIEGGRGTGREDNFFA